MRLASLLTRHEGKTLEFKRDLSSGAGMLKTVAAFANSSGGTLVVGVEDRTKVVAGLVDALDAEERLASMIADGISPQLVPDIEILPWRNTNVLVAHVPVGPGRPHFVTAQGPGGVYVRIGSTNRQADVRTIAELGRAARNESFDEAPMPHVDSEALDFRAASESFAEAGRKLRRADLRTLRLVTEHERRTVPTAGGVILFASREVREREFPDAYWMLGRLTGEAGVDLADSAEVHARPDQAVDEVMAFVKKHITMSVIIRGVRHENVWAYPLQAMREAVINATVHADYGEVGIPLRVAIHDDRIVVENAGILVPGMSVEAMLGGASKARNRVIARVFKELGLIEQWGKGVPRMLSACREAGLADPEWEELDDRVRVTLRAEYSKPSGLDAADTALLTALGREGGQSTSGLAALIGRSTRATRMRLASLVDRGLVAGVGTGPNDPKRVYYVAEERAPYGEDG